MTRTIHNTHYPLLNTLYSLLNKHYSIHIPHYTLHLPHYTLHFPHYTLHFPLYTFLLTLLVCCTQPAGAATRYLSHQEIQTLIDRGKATLLDGENIEAAKLLLQAKLQADEGGYNDLTYLADIYLSNVYFNLDEISESMYYAQEALTIAEAENMDWEHRYTAMNSIAGSYFRQKDYKRAKEIIDQCLAAALAEKDSVAIVDFAMNLVRITTRQNNISQAQYYDSTMVAYLSSSYEKEIRHYLCDVEMEMYFAQNKYDKARERAQYLLDSSDYASGQSAALYTLCQIAKNEEKYAEALQLAHRALENASFSRKRTLYDLMGNIYLQMNDQKLALNCKDSALMWSDSAQQRADHQLLEQSQVQSEASRIRREFEEQHKELAATQRIVTVGIIVLLLLAAVGLWLFRRHRVKTLEERRQIEDAQRQQQEELKQKKLELLSATQITSARNEVVSDLITSLQEITAIRQNPEVKSLISNLKQQLGDSNRQDEFLINFRQSNPDFVEKLLAKHPGLLDSDLRFLSYVLQRLPQSDIASLLNITPDSCKRRKIRISKKLGLESSTELYEYLCSFK